MTPIIQAQELSRWYGIVMGLNNVSFEVQPGLTGLVGPNGAGKSTLIQIVTGQLKPSSGQLTVYGERPWNNPRLLRRMGYCPEGEAVPKDLRPTDWLLRRRQPAPSRFSTWSSWPAKNGANAWASIPRACDSASNSARAFSTGPISWSWMNR